MLDERLHMFIEDVLHKCNIETVDPLTHEGLIVGASKLIEKNDESITTLEILDTKRIKRLSRAVASQNFETDSSEVFVDDTRQQDKYGIKFRTLKDLNHTTYLLTHDPKNLVYNEHTVYYETIDEWVNGFLSNTEKQLNGEFGGE